MPWHFLRNAALAACFAVPAVVHAQKATQDSRPAVAPFGVAGLGADGAAVVGAGLRLFPAPGAGGMQQQPPPAASTGPGVKPGLSAPPPASTAVVGKPPALPSPGGVTVAGRSPTAFNVVPAVSARVRQQVLAATLPTSPNPDGLRQAIASGAPWQEFDRLLVQHGYDPRDLADVLAAFYLLAWEVSTGGDAAAQPAGIAAVRGQARQMLAANATTARMTEADRQATAEALAFYAMAIVARSHDLQSAGGGQALAAFRNEVASTISQQQGFDLRRFTLTPTGFQAR